MKHLAFATLIFCALIAFSRCGNFPVAKNEAPAINTVAANAIFTIILPENHTTGYTWQMKQDYNEAVINQVNEVWHGNEKGIYFNLRSLAAGQTTLTFISRKYQDTADIKHFIVKIGDN